MNFFQPCGALHPLKPKVYEILRDVFAELISLFDDPEFFHMGGDEVYQHYWIYDSEIRQWIQKFGYGNSTDEGFHRLWAEFHQRTFYDLRSFTNWTRPILWSSTLTGKFSHWLNPNEWIIHNWEKTDDNVTLKLLQDGFSITVQR